MEMCCMQLQQKLFIILIVVVIPIGSKVVDVVGQIFIWQKKVGLKFVKFWPILSQGNIFPNIYCFSDYCVSTEIIGRNFSR